jgi:hypothetical protein
MADIIFGVKSAYEKPVEGEQLYIDDEMYIVSNVSDNIGMLEIDLERNDH